MSTALHYGRVIKDKNKTLSELGIKDGEIILFIIKNKNSKYKYEKGTQQHKLTEDERIQVKKWLLEYRNLKSIEDMLNNEEFVKKHKNLLILNSRESLYNFEKFIQKKECKILLLNLQL